MRAPLRGQVQRQLTEAQAVLAAAAAAVDRFRRDPVDPASVYRPHTARSTARAGARNDREAQAWQRLHRAQQAVDVLKVKARTGSVEQALTRQDVLGAVVVRTAHGWHTVARVNTSTVSVLTGHSWVDRYPFDQLLEVRHPDPRAGRCEVLNEIAELLPAGWELEDPNGGLELVCPHGHTIEPDGQCPEGCVSPLRALGLI